MRQHFHRCPSLRVIAVAASDVSGGRRGGSAILEELCEAKRLARCVGLAECDVLASAQKRELLVARVTRMREEEGGTTSLGEVPNQRGVQLQELRTDLLDEREALVEDNRRIEAERAAGAAIHDVATASEEAELGAVGISIRGDVGLAELRSGRLDAIDRALDAIAAGHYGACARCRQAIEIDRLRMAPDTLVCGSCAGEALPVP